MTPAISVLLPLYNGEAYLAEQIDSILGQSLSDIELVLTDDGSTDGTLPIAQDFARREGRIRILPTAGNAGQKRRLAQLVRASSAPLIAISDQDDIWDREKLANLSRALGDKALAFGRSELIDAEGKPLNRRLLDYFGSHPRPGDRLTLLFKPQVSAHALLGRREIFTDQAFSRFQPFDWLLGLDAAFSSGTIYVEDAITCHRMHASNQANGAIGLRRSSTVRFTLVELYKKLHSTHRARFGFVERLEHLGHSPIIPEVHRKALNEIGLLCRGAWIDLEVSRPSSHRRLRETILDRLGPLRGSADDWNTAVDNVGFLTRAQFHPQTLVGARWSQLLGRGQIAPVSH